MATIPSYNPPVPFLGHIAGGMQVGQTIRIRGQMNHGHNARFSINILKGPCENPKDDIALHISVRPANGQVVRNHMHRQRWGTEEITGTCPIFPGQVFEFTIVAEQKFYIVAVNGIHICTFKHRLPMQSAAYFVSVEGEAQLTYVGY